MTDEGDPAPLKEEWQKQLSHFVKTTEQLEQIINLTVAEREALRSTASPWGTTPYFASLMARDDPGCPIRRQIVPGRPAPRNGFLPDIASARRENRTDEENRPDGIARQRRDRVAFSVSRDCGLYCRQCSCMRPAGDGLPADDFDIDAGLAWIAMHSEIREVLLTGGDPLLLPDEQISYLIDRLRAMPHIEMIRFASRAPIVLPQRITESLKKILGQYHRVPIWISTQCNHPQELTDEVAWAVYDLLRCGVNVGSQAVWLKGVNDDAATLEKLHQKLLRMRIRPCLPSYDKSALAINHLHKPLAGDAGLTRAALCGETTDLVRPLVAAAPGSGRAPLRPGSCIAAKNDAECSL